MSLILQIGDRTIASAELIPLLRQYQMLPQLWREILTDKAIVSVQLSSTEQAIAIEKHYKKNQLINTTERQAYLQHYGMSATQLEALAVRESKVEKFKLITWENKLESFFLAHKSQLDRVIYSILRTKEPELAQELYFRIQAQEQSFAECAAQYSQGIEAQTNGLIGPVELSVPHPKLAKMLSISQPGQLLPPTRLGEWFLVVRLEKFIPAVFDEAMRQKLLDELFKQWLNEQTNQIHVIEQDLVTL
jgi:parvulin-like peptidyl-prolyl isomerase